MPSYHLDCWSGLAGDMFLGACLDLGMPLAVLEDAVARLALPGVTVEAGKAARGGVTGTRFRVLIDGRPLEGPDPGEEPAPGARSHAHPHDQAHEHRHDFDPGLDHAYGHANDDEREHSHEPGHGHPHAHPHEGHGRDLAAIRRLIGESSLAAPVRERALALFERLGAAEAKVHGLPLDRVHFHEVGAVDSIVDLVGAAAAVEHLAPERLTSGPVNVGSGHVHTAHGRLPVPAPATAELLAGIPVHGGPGGELTTPTGAVLLAVLVDEFVALPDLVLDGTGYGLGRRELAAQPNAVRLLRGYTAAVAGAGSLAAAGPAVAGEVMVVECEVDDLPGEGFGFLMERLLEAGALDVYFTPVQMKKSRPGTLVTLLCRPAELEPLAGLLLSESGSLGCRYHRAARFEAERRTVEVATPFGPVRIKQASWGGRPLAAAPEFEDCRRLALAAGVPWREVYRQALTSAAAARG
jgi:uncharacterized protein (TIGR00299 family) protein